MKRLSILGSTGSIGRNTLEVAAQYPDKFRVTGLAVRSSIEPIQRQIEKFKPDVVAVYDESSAEKLKRKNPPVEILAGEEGLIEVAKKSDVDMVVSAIVGSEGLLPTFAAVQAGKELALATKEALVMAGKVIMSEANKSGVRILPVDSEHSAVFQCLEGRKGEEVEKIILTASGGPFLRKDLSQLKYVTPDAALKHPNWNMGRKISIDSATLINKGLEVIEAYWLFDLPLSKIEVILHPHSIIHSLVRFIDGSVIAHMSLPDMKGPIAYALSYPERFGNILPVLDLTSIRELTFEEPDAGRYPALSLTYDALRAGGTMPCVLNAANEVAVEAFLDGRITFTDITCVIQETMNEHDVSEGNTVQEVIEHSDRARKKALEIVDSRD